MSAVLFSFLGRAEARGGARTYKTTTYDFGGRHSAVTTLFVSALRDDLARHDAALAPDRIVVLGTTGSMWDEFVYQIAPASDAQFALVEDLSASALANATTAEQLRAASTFVSRETGIAIDLVLVPYGRTTAEALSIADLIRRSMGSADRILLDVTHGFRHLPMLGLFAAMTVEALSDASVVAVWYGALDMAANGVTPVIRLDGLLDYARWIRALAAFEASGDLSTIGPIIEADSGTSLARDLAAAAFRLRTYDVSGAQKAASRAVQALRRSDGPLSRPFRDRVIRRLNWSAASSLAAQQIALARLKLEDRDYASAVILGLEAALSDIAEGELGQDPTSRSAREAAKAHLRNRSYPDRQRASAFARLTKLRNAVAHSSEPADGDARDILGSEQRLVAEISRLFDSLFGPAVSRP